MVETVQFENERGFAFTIGGREFKLNTATNYLGVDASENYAWVNAQGIALIGDRERALYEQQQREALPKLSYGTVLDIEGIGLYALIAPESSYLDGDSPVLIPLAGQGACSQAAKRLKRSVYTTDAREKARLARSGGGPSETELSG